MRAPRAGALLGLTVGAIAMRAWIASLIVPFGSASAGIPDALIVAQWVTPVLVGVAIAWTGINTVGRVISAVVAVVLAWVAPAAMTGIGSALGARVYVDHPAEMLDFGLGVFRSALLIPELALRPIITTVVTAAIGLGIRALLPRRATPASGTNFTRDEPSARQET
ncbi:MULTISPECIES: hypothetical protein [unclassified Microbacterium]|uniref:hypothetical protein n=1 Tax=unclassified Microbacterium TaxID=2609290 RepID=UPI00214C4137|nr:MULTISPECIES: hypothetical protein [unclassified Microbacterium]MCR2783931.1 hypothetical protein [Microbacterium sp. zg.B96]WIM15225.1 hypothetical protein QNO11_11825 [Microbacterium sp. zg-B96]